MADGGNIKIDILGDSTNFSRALQTAGDNLDGLVKSSQGATNKIGKDLSKATNNAQKKLDGFTESAGDADSVMMGLAGAIDLVNPALGGMVRVSGDVLASVESIGRAIKFSNPVFIALSVAAAALGGAYFLLTGDTEETEEAAKSLREEQERLEDVFKSSAEAIADSRIDLLVASGALNQYEAAVIRAGEATEARFKQPIEEATAALAAAKGEAALFQDKTILSKDEADQMMAAISRVDMYRERLKTLRGAIDAETAAKREAIEAGEEKDKADAEADESAKKAEKRSRARAAAQREAAKAAKEYAAQLKKANDEQIKFNKEQTKGWQEAAEAWAALQDRQRKEMQDMKDAERDAYHERLGYMSDFIGASGDLAEGLAARLGASAEQQAMASYIVSKASALAEIAVNTIVAASKAAAQTGVGAAVAVPAITALGAMQAAAVLATPPPKFHSGGMIAPDERMITAQTGEAVLSRSGVAAAGGASGVNALNRGGSGREIVVVNQYRHRVFDSFIMDNLRRTGSPLAAAISATGSKAGIA